MWLVLGVNLMEINAATCFPGTFIKRYYWWFRNRKANQEGCIWDLFSIAGFQLPFPQLVMFAETTILHQVIQFVTKLHPRSLGVTFSTISKGHGISISQRRSRIESPPPGDSMWPFHPLNHLKGSLNHPKEGYELNHQVMIWFIIKLKLVMFGAPTDTDRPAAGRPPAAVGVRPPANGSQVMGETVGIFFCNRLEDGLPGGGIYQHLPRGAK